MNYQEADQALESELKARLHSLSGKSGTSAYHPDHPCAYQIPLNLEEAIRYSLLAPGKKIRARLLLACSQMLGLSPDSVLPAAVALEMIHCFTLIHDDLPCMDNDDFRRGLPSNHKKFGEGLALLAGDGLMALGIDLFLESSVESSRLLKAVKRFVGMMGPRGVIGGQAAESLLGPYSSLEDMRKMHQQKTGALFAAAILIPKDFGGISDESDQGLSLSSFADELGLAFQIADDLEDQNEFVSTSPSAAKNILYYLSAREAANMSTDRLQKATSRLLNCWGEKSAPLIQISNEVLNKIKAVYVGSIQE